MWQMEKNSQRKEEKDRYDFVNSIGWFSNQILYPLCLKYWIMRKRILVETRKKEYYFTKRQFVVF
jgi:hypothetical protein